MTQKYIFNLIDELVDKIKKSDYRFFYFDLDGTLAPIVKDPSTIAIHTDVIKVLEFLSSLPQTYVGIVSGRELSFLKKYFVSSKIILIGSHGMESSIKLKELEVQRATQIANKIRKEIAAQKISLLSNQGAIIESKKYGVALHYRMCDSTGKKNVRRIARTIGENIPDVSVTIFRGKQVAEINPKIGWNKGTAIESLEEKFLNLRTNVFEMYIGDDISDEKAFRVINAGHEFSVRVRKKKSSIAKYYLKSQIETEVFLKKIYEDLSELK